MVEVDRGMESRAASIVIAAKGFCISRPCKDFVHGPNHHPRHRHGETGSLETGQNSTALVQSGKSCSFLCRLCKKTVKVAGAAASMLDVNMGVKRPVECCQLVLPEAFVAAWYTT